ncbi:hypothetical protein SLS56_008838 [Neofusicoccum ribis]|uniref:Fork-head domain-containing protein n=1 Tax=Neofusicoccum ribis TaxID=45134 RepID=A0ABR3SIZ9_9PEZI
MARIMTITDPSAQLRPEEFQMPFRSDTPRTSFLSHVPVRQTSTSAMPSPALLVPSKQENSHPQTLEDHEQFFDVVGDPASGAPDFSFMNYDLPLNHTDFSNYQITAPSHPPDLPSGLDYASPLCTANQPLFADSSPAPYSPPGFDRNCPRTFYSLGPDQLSDVCFPAGYHFPMPQQGFCFPDQIYQEPSPPMEGAFSSLSPSHDAQSMDTSVYPTPVSTCLPFHNPPEYRPNPQLVQAPHDDCNDLGQEQDDVNGEKDKPYAQLIFRALLEAPGHTMVLREIYNWFLQNTGKARDKETKGWQNSIRHNLSMNGAFQKVELPPGEDAKKGNMWRLTEDAIRQGVKSTTRYRPKPQRSRGAKTPQKVHLHPPAAQRQAAGAKGGNAARRSARSQQMQQQEKEQQVRQQPQQQRRSEHDLFEHRLGITPDAVLNPEADPCPISPYMLRPIPGGPHPPYVLPHGPPGSSDYMQQNLHHSHHHHYQASQHSEPGSTMLSPVDLAFYHSFPNSPAQDQGWAYNAISDVPSLFGSAAGCCPGGFNCGCGLEHAHTDSTSPSDSDDPPTPTNNPGGLDVDLDGHLAPPAPTTFFEAKGATL